MSNARKLVETIAGTRFNDTVINMYASWVEVGKDITTDKFTINVTSEGTYITVLKAGTSGHVIIPESVDYGGTTYLIDGIYDIFKNNTAITGVTLPENINQLPSDTFAGCTNFRNLTTYSKSLSIINLQLPSVFNLTAYYYSQAAIELRPENYGEQGNIYMTGNQFLSGDIETNFTALSTKILYFDGGTKISEETYKLDTSHWLETATKDNYTFVGWNTKEDLSGEIIKYYNSSNTEELKLYAVWEKEKHSITYYLDGGVNPVENSSSFYSADGLTLKDPAKTGYAFAGWYTEATFENKVSEIAVGTNKDVELYAKWEINQTVIENEQKKKIHKIVYELNGGTNSVNNPDEFNEDNGVTFDKPTRPGYRFVCWCSDPSLSRKMNSIAAGVSNDVKVYARWSKVTVKQQKVLQVKNKKGKKLYVKIKHISGVAGSELQYSMHKKFKKKNKLVQLGKTKRSTTIKKLNKGKTYYVRVRSYKYDSVGNKVYGKWSPKKKITIKK